MRKVASYDAFQRINYLYQISKEITDINPVLAAYYNTLIINVAKKNVLKIHPDIKKQICKKCRSNLKMTKQLKIKYRNNTKYVQTKCKICNSERNTVIDKKKECIWLDKSYAVLEVIN